MQNALWVRARGGGLCGASLSASRHRECLEDASLRSSCLVCPALLPAPLPQLRSSMIRLAASGSGWPRVAVAVAVAVVVAVAVGPASGIKRLMGSSPPIKLCIFTLQAQPELPAQG